MILRGRPGGAPSSFPSRRWFDLGVITACCLGLLFHARRYDFISDDTFITLRYARNLNHGVGLVFNPGERVEGFTSPLWTWLLAMVGYVHADLLLSSRLLGVAAALVTILLTFLLARALCDPTGHSMALLAAPLVLACDGSYACWAASGMETPLFGMLIIGGLLATVKGRDRLSAGTAGALVLCRPEGLAVAGILGLIHTAKRLRDGARRWLRWWVVCGGVTAGLFLWRAACYADLLPNTYYAKSGGSWMQIGRGLAYFLSYCGDHESLPILLIVLTVPVFLLGGQARLVAGTAAALWLIAILAGGDGLPMYRFSVAPLPLIACLEGALLAAIDRRYLRRFLSSPAWRGLVLAGVVLGLAVIHASPPRRFGQHSLYLYQKTVEIPRWTLVGNWFKEHAQKNESLAAVPIGAVSFYSGLVVRDILGLTDRHIARRTMPNMGAGWAGHEKHDGQYILGLRPTYLLLGNIDVTCAPRDPSRFPFIPYANRWIWERERDFYDSDLIERDYEPRSYEIAPGQFLNLYRLKEPIR